MTTFILSLLISFWGTFISIKLLKPLAIKCRLVDKPNERKIHIGEIPLIGGVSVYFGFFMSLILMEQKNTISLKYFMIATGVMLLIGLLDDKYNLSVRFRMFCQLIAASIMMFSENLKIDYLGNILFFGTIQLDWFAVPFTYLAIIGAINMFNMVDGIDGLIGGLTLSTVLSLAFLFLLDGQFCQSWICLTLITALFPFLLFNLTNTDHPKLKKIFMGDAGSMFLGFSVVWLLAIGTQGTEASFKPVTALWIISIPLMDMAGVIIRRRKNGKSPFKPDRDHLHHIFMNAGFTSRQTLLFITGLSLLISAVGIFLERAEIPEIISFVLFLLVFGSYLFLVKRVRYSIRVLKLIKPIIEFNQYIFKGLF